MPPQKGPKTECEIFWSWNTTENYMYVLPSRSHVLISSVDYEIGIVYIFEHLKAPRVQFIRKIIIIGQLLFIEIKLYFT